MESTHPPWRTQWHNGRVRLDERDGVLYYGQTEIGPAVEQIAIVPWPLREKICAAVGDPTLHVYAIYRCKSCGQWAAGSGSMWCSVECRRELKTTGQRQRRERARAARAAAEHRCAHCQAPMSAQRSTRRFCSDSCRVRAHRANPQAAQ
jgi:hypothetical protein